MVPIALRRIKILAWLLEGGHFPSLLESKFLKFLHLLRGIT